MFTMQPATTTSGTQIQFGTAPVNWNNFDLENWNPVVPFPQILDEMVAAGYTLTEWDASFGSDPEMLNRERDAREISYVGAYRWIDFLDESGLAQSLAGIEEILPTLVAIGVDNLIVADSLRPERVAIAGAVPVDGSKSLSEDELQTLARNLHRLASRVQESGITVRYHNHVGSYIESPAEVAALLPYLDLTLVDLCFDTGHYAFGGGDALEFLRSHIDSIGLLHLKDVDDQVLDRARQHHWSFQESLRNYIFSPLGRGGAQVGAIIGELVRSQFGGYVIIEQDTCVGDQTVNARDNLATALAFEARVQSAGDTHD
jgi:inosose dehydratase